MTSRFRPRFRTVAFTAALAALFLVTAFVRFMMLGNGFANDHFLHLAGAQQMLFGEWPTKDFLDPGMPLMYATSALAQLLLGRTLFAEAVLVVLAYALAAVLTAAAVRELTGSRVLALVAAALEVAIMPRDYGYPKVLLYAAGFLLLQRYVTRPTTRRLFALAALVAIAFLFRHDHGIYLGVGGVLAALLAPGSEARSGGVRRALVFIAMVGALTAPYVVSVAAYGGLGPYLQTGLEFRRAELARQAYAWPSFFGGRPHEAALFFGYWALPAAALLLVATYGRRDDVKTVVARVVPIAVVALLVNWTFLRDPLTGRLQDAIVPVVTLGSWLVSGAWRSRFRWIWRPVSALLVVVFANSVLEVGGTLDHLYRAGLLKARPRRSDTIEDVVARLRAPYATRVLPSRPAVALLPFYSYVRRCTTREHRVLVMGNAAEVLFFTQRAFAGGQSVFVEGYYASEARQRSVVSTLMRQVVPFVVIPGKAYTGDYRATFPLIGRYLSDRYVPLATFGDPETGAEVLFDRTLPIQSRDAETGWPCLAP